MTAFCRAHHATCGLAFVVLSVTTASSPSKLETRASIRATCLSSVLHEFVRCCSLGLLFSSFGRCEHSVMQSHQLLALLRQLRNCKGIQDCEIAMTQGLVPYSGTRVRGAWSPHKQDTLIPESDTLCKHSCRCMCRRDEQYKHVPNTSLSPLFSYSSRQGSSIVAAPGPTRLSKV